MAEEIGALRAELSANTAQFDADMKAAAKAVKGFSQSASKDATAFSSTMAKAQGTVGKLSHELSSFQRIGDLVGGAFGETAARAAVFADTLSRAAEASKISAAGLIALGAAASAGAVVGLLALGREISETTDEIGKSAKTIGISAEALQELRYAADLSRVSTEELNTGLERFGKSVGDALITPTSQAAQLFRSLGVNLRDVNGQVKPMEVLFGEMADKVNNLASAQQKASVISLLFGRSGLALTNLFQGGSKAIAAMREEAHKYGYVISNEAVAAGEDLNDDLGRLTATLEGAKTAFEVGLIKPIDEMAKSLANGNVGLAEFAEKLGEGVGGSITSVLQGIKDLNDGVEKLGGLWDQLPSGVKDLFANPTASAPPGSTFGLAPNGGGVLGYLQKFGLVGQSAPVATAPPAPLAPKVPAPVIPTGTLNPVIDTKAVAQVEAFNKALAGIKQETAAAGMDKVLDAVTIETTKLAVSLKATTPQIKLLFDAIKDKDAAEQASRFRDAMRDIADQIRDVGVDKYTKQILDFSVAIRPTPDQMKAFTEQIKDLKAADLAQTIKGISDQTRDLSLTRVDAQVADLTESMNLSADQAEKYRAALETLDDAQHKVTLTVPQAKEALADLGAQAETQGISDVAQGMIDIATGAKSASEAVLGLIGDIANLAAQEVIEIGIRTALNSAFGSVGGKAATGADFTVGTYGGNAFRLKGFATGGSFRVGGIGGTDSQTIAFRATPGEHVTVDTPGSRRGGNGGDTYYIDNTGADANAIRRLEGALAQVNASIEHRSVAANMAKGRRSVAYRKAIGS